MNTNKKESWYTRPVFFVADIDKALDFYCQQLSFTKMWDYKSNDKIIVAQVNRGSKCELILSENAERRGMGRVFIELLPKELNTLKNELKSNKIKHKEIHWGMPVIVVKDPSGNELFFPTDENS